MAEKLVLLNFDDYGDAGRVARITFNNPAKRNALGLAGKEQFIETMTGLKHDESLRAVVLPRYGHQASLLRSERWCLCLSVSDQPAGISCVAECRRPPDTQKAPAGR